MRLNDFTSAEQRPRLSQLSDSFCLPAAVGDVIATFINTPERLLEATQLGLARLAATTAEGTAFEDMLHALADLGWPAAMAVEIRSVQELVPLVAQTAGVAIGVRPKGSRSNHAIRFLGEAVDLSAMNPRWNPLGRVARVFDPERGRRENAYGEFVHGPALDDDLRRCGSYALVIWPNAAPPSK